MIESNLRPGRDLRDTETPSWTAGGPRLDSPAAESRAWAGRLRRDLEAEAIAASTSMEGVAVTLEEVHRILAGDRPSETREEDAALVRGYRDAMSFVLRRADDASFRWDRELLIGLHDRVLAGNWGEGAGRFRTGPAYVVDGRSRELVFQPPPAEAVPDLVDAAVRPCRRGSSIPPSPPPGSTRPWRPFTRSGTATAGPRGWSPPWRCTGGASSSRSSPRSRNGGDDTCPTTTERSGAWAGPSMRPPTSRPSSAPTWRRSSTRSGPSTSGNASSGRSGWPWRRPWPRPTSPPGWPTRPGMPSSGGA